MLDILNTALLRPKSIEVDILAGSIEPGRNLMGMGSSIDMTGGGLLSCRYSGITPGNRNPNAARHLSSLLKLNGSVKTIIVPLMLDFLAPFSGSWPPAQTTALTTFGDDSTFSDGSMFSQTVVSAELAADAGLNAGTVSITVTSGGALQPGVWFSIEHTNRSHRAYLVTEIDSETANENETITYVVGIRPTLREGTAAGRSLEFVRPKCLMKLRPGTTVPMKFDGYWMASADLAFIEAAPAEPVTLGTTDYVAGVTTTPSTVDAARAYATAAGASAAAAANLAAIATQAAADAAESAAEIDTEALKREARRQAIVYG